MSNWGCVAPSRVDENVFHPEVAADEETGVFVQGLKAQQTNFVQPLKNPSQQQLSHTKYIAGLLSGLNAGIPGTALGSAFPHGHRAHVRHQDGTALRGFQTALREGLILVSSNMPFDDWNKSSARNASRAPAGSPH